MVSALLRLGILLVLFCVSSYAQDAQFLPEIDAHLTLNPFFKVYLQAKDDREGGDSEQFTFGPSLQFYVRPLEKLKRPRFFDLDETKSRPLVLETGYRIISAPGASPEHRAIEAVTVHLPLPERLLLTERNRADLDWKNGSFNWRYRNKLTVERPFSIHSFHFVPYVAAEPFYESQYKKWSSTDLYAGFLFPVAKRFEFDAYYEHENDTGKAQNRQEHFVGLALFMYFPWDRR
jgi:hypothetical protein